MNKLGLSSVIRKKRKKYVAIQPEQIAENILNRKFETYEELELDIKEYINFYNTKRLQKKLNSLSPLEYRAQAA